MRIQIQHFQFETQPQYFKGGGDDGRVIGGKGRGQRREKETRDCVPDQK